MNNKFKDGIESIFRKSSSQDELFDAFRSAIEHRIKDADFYKSLLWNKALSADELEMYAAKICREFPELCFDIYFAVGKIYDSVSTYGRYKERGLYYYQKASGINPDSVEPYAAMAEMYNADLDTPSFTDIVETIENGIQHVELKSKLCFLLSKLYKLKEEEEFKWKEYQKLGEKFRSSGH